MYYTINRLLDAGFAVTQVAIVLVLGSALVASWDNKTSEDFIAIHSSIRTQCAVMLAAGNSREELVVRALESNQKLFEYQRKLMHPVGQYYVSPKLSSVQPISCVKEV